MDLMERARLGEENKQRLRAMYEGVIAGKPSDPQATFAENAIVYEPALAPWSGTYRGLEGQKALGAAQKGWMVNDKLEILDLYADGDHVISKIYVTMKEGGEKLMLSEHVLYHEGKVVEMRIFVFDEARAPISELFVSKE